VVVLDVTGVAAVDSRVANHLIQTVDAARLMGAKAIIVRSFARIAETNLKKQGVLPLVFSDPATYDEIGEQDRISLFELADLAPDRPLECRIHRPDGTTLDFTCTHSLSDEHIEWYRAGSALNLIRRQFGG
jgi:aconitate hydratase